MGGASARADGPYNRVLIPNHDRAPERPPSDLLWDFAGETMGTTWAVTLVPPPGKTRETFQSAIEAELARIIALFSHWEPTSELARFNAAPEGFWAVSQPFWDLLNKAMDIADDTDGAVDPTLGALVDLWGFGPPGPRPLDSFGTAPSLPLDDEVAEARARSGWQSLRLNRQQRAVQQSGEMKLDLSGIAKGHAVDVVSERLHALGATSHLVEIGGELRGRGVKPDGRPWWTELQQAPGSPEPRTLVALFDLAVATSGDWVRGFETYGQRYSHTLNGRIGRPIDNGVASVTVLADTALYADAMATALTVMGPIEGPAFATAMKIAAAFVVRGDTGLTEIVTPAFQAMLDEGA
ncbi:FAD:protein FMN transferase [Brevundimonas kwangchunensis]|uniref:FAD:protein FMN transferase n=1 Tax=Brevundimonas kwangchunensis TaxID=322163 RepID=A0ABP3RJG1_9CAUL